MRAKLTPKAERTAFQRTHTVAVVVREATEKDRGNVLNITPEAALLLAVDLINAAEDALAE